MSRRSKKRAESGKVDAARLRASDPPAVEMSGNTSSRPPKVGSRPAGWPNRRMILGVCIFLVVIVWVVFGQTREFGFVNYDDNAYVYQNPMVQAGLTWSGFKWAFTTMDMSNWNPLLWLSFMLDRQLFGLNAGWFHLVNVFFHAANAVLLFVLFLRLTSRLWPSAFIAAVFACHPQHVESVAWVAERKDVLAAFFGLLALLAYEGYARKRSQVENQGSSTNIMVKALDSRPWTRNYVLALLFYACGLMAKPMLVTLPFVFLLLDYWPLQRVPNFELRLSCWSRLIREKWPFFVLTVASGMVTTIAQQRGMAYGSSYGYPLSDRIGNAAIAYVEYLFKSVYPVNLAVFYPLPEEMGWRQIAGAVLILVVMTGLIWRARWQCPYLLTGWLWYLGMLVPVIGLVPVGTGLQAMADRYTYLPQIGWFLLLTWGATELCAGFRYRRVVLGGLSAIILAALICCARTQVSYWQNSETLFRHALAVTKNNYLAHNNLGVALDGEGQTAQAIRQLQQAIRLKPDYADAHNNLGIAFGKEGRITEAISQFQEAIHLEPNLADAHVNLGVALDGEGQTAQAIRQYQKAVRVEPNYALAHFNLGAAFGKEGRIAEAIRQYQDAIRLEPNYAKAHNNLGVLLGRQGQIAEAINQFREAVRLKPDYPEARNNLDIALSMEDRIHRGNQTIPQSHPPEAR